MRVSLTLKAAIILFLACYTFSCKKTGKETLVQKDKFNYENEASGGGGISSPCREELEPGWYLDSVLTQTVLGSPLQGNPYSVANMQQASINLYGNSNGIVANKKYVRFRPADEEQVQVLEDTELDLYDYPLDRDVIQEGDYYLQQGLTENDIPWYYTIVDINYIPPIGITYEIISEIYVPDNDLLLEDEAFRITGNSVSNTCGAVLYNPPLPCERDPCFPECPNYDPGNCGSGGGGGSTDYRKPAGQILEWDSNLGSNVAVRRVKVKVRRYFKLDETYTDNAGRYAISKKFNNKVNIFIKFKNEKVKITRLFGVPVIRARWPLKRGIGTYSGPLNNINWVFDRGNSVDERNYRYWWAAQIMNARLEFDEMAVQEGIGQLPNDRLVITLTRLGIVSSVGSTPMNNHRTFSGYPTADYIKYFFASPLANYGALYFNALANGTLFRTIDMGLGYRTLLL